MTAQERTGWRDRELSLRHRDWGFNCPAADLDFLMVEYNLGVPVALVEYKHHQAKTPELRHPTYRAIYELAKLADLPFLIAFYWPNEWAFRVDPVNDKARGTYGDGMMLTERRFVKSLYYLRGLKVQEQVLANLRDELPRQEALAMV